MKPGTPASCRSQCSTLASLDPRPRMMQATRSRRAPWGFFSYPCIVLAPVHALDLPDVGLDTGRLRLGDRANDQLRPDFQVIAVAVSVDPFQLSGLRRNEEIEEESAVMSVQPAREFRQPSQLFPVHCRIAVRVGPRARLTRSPRRPPRRSGSTRQRAVQWSPSSRRQGEPHGAAAFGLVGLSQQRVGGRHDVLP